MRDKQVGFVCNSCKKTWPSKDRHEQDEDEVCPDCFDGETSDDDSDDTTKAIKQTNSNNKGGFHDGSHPWVDSRSWGLSRAGRRASSASENK